MVSIDREYGAEADRNIPANIFSIDFYHLTSLLAVDVRPDLKVGMAFLFRKPGIIDKTTLSIIEHCERKGEVVHDKVLSRYAWYVFHAVNQVRSSLRGPRKVNVTIDKGPVENFFESERWDELKTRLDGRVNFVNFANLVAQMIAEQRENLPIDLIKDNSLAGVITMWEPGQEPNIDLPLPDPDMVILNN